MVPLYVPVERTVRTSEGVSKLPFGLVTDTVSVPPATLKPEIQTPLAGLYFASMSQVYPWDRGTNFAIEIGRRAAKLMLAK